jgi:monoamine oxidase
MSPRAGDGSSSGSEDFDIVIVGAGVSGINTAYSLKNQLPSIKFTIFEGRDDIGGTWDLFKYPGIRSDSEYVPSNLQTRSFLPETQRSKSQCLAIKRYIVFRVFYVLTILSLVSTHMSSHGTHGAMPISSAKALKSKSI